MSCWLGEIEQFRDIEVSGEDMRAEELVHRSEGFVEVYSSKHGLDKVCHSVGKGDWL